MSKHKKPEDETGNDQVLSELTNDELIERLNQAEQKANDNWERALRSQAEVDNAVRRAERDVANAHKYALEKFVNELLPIVDSLELSAASVPPDMQVAAKPVLEGVELTLKMFYSAMEKFGIQAISPLGQPFNPEFEQAISMQESDQPAGTVLSVLQKGYTLNNRLVRPALVVVAKPKE